MRLPNDCDNFLLQCIYLGVLLRFVVVLKIRILKFSLAALTIFTPSLVDGVMHFARMKLRGCDLAKSRFYVPCQKRTISSGLERYAVKSRCN